jgi:hypothetical protein
MSEAFKPAFAQTHVDFQESAFLPFEHYKRQASQLRRDKVAAANNPARRKIDFTDAVEVTDVAHIDISDFADTIPVAYGDVTVIEQEIIEPAIVEPVHDMNAYLQARVDLARVHVAVRAFDECLHNGFFPPRCQRCSR